jgi:hypothetical protein
MNEFAALGPEHLQFLRIFILNEGRIRDMEAALGVSYPTIKARIKDLKAVLQLVGNEMTAGAPDKNAPIGKDDLSDIISKLEKGELTPEDAIRTLSRAPDD